MAALYNFHYNAAICIFFNKKLKIIFLKTSLISKQVENNDIKKTFVK